MLVLSTHVPLILMGTCPASCCFIMSTVNSFGFAGIILKIAVPAPACQVSAVLNVIFLLMVIRLMTLKRV